MKSTFMTISVKKMYDDYIQGDLKVCLEYQRGVKWKRSQQIWLIDALLRGTEIPVFYVHQKQEEPDTLLGKTKVAPCGYIVDGQQRLNAIADFIQNKDHNFILPSMHDPRLFTIRGESPTWAGKTFESLTDKDKDCFLNRELFVVKIDADDDAVREFFISLQEGKPL